MADAYEPYHVLQQSRRDKLRIPSLDSHFHFHHPHPPSSSGGGAGVYPLGDSDYLAAGGFHSNNNSHISNPSYSNFMGFLGGPSSSSSNAVAVAGDHSFHDGLSSGDVLVFKPEPLSLSLSSHPRLTYDLVVPGVVNSGFGRSAAEAAAATVTVASRSSGPLGPFTGYASILKGSRFLKPAQILLDEFCNVGHGIYTDEDDSSLLFDPTVESLCGTSDSGGGEYMKNKSKLISMLDEVLYINDTILFYIPYKEPDKPVNSAISIVLNFLILPCTYVYYCVKCSQFLVGVLRSWRQNLINDM